MDIREGQSAAQQPLWRTYEPLVYGPPAPPEAYGPNAVPGPVPLRPYEPARAPRRSGAVGLAAVAVLSAAVASASTVGLITAFGFNAPSPQGNSTPATQQPSVQLATDSDSADDLADTVAAATQSVVTITSQSMSRDRFSPFGIPSTGVGSGIVITSSGLILTNNHVIEGADQLTVTTADGQQLSATVVRTDPSHDMAVIKASGGTLTPATLGDSARIRVGETVLAIGSPLGEFTETVTRGIVSALNRSLTVGDRQTGRSESLSELIQTDAAINPGNSGGALINDRGEVIGMNTAVAGSAEGIGFAIPINAAKQLIDQAASASA